MTGCVMSIRKTVIEKAKNTYAIKPFNTNGLHKNIK